MARRTTKTTAAKAAAPVATEPVVEITNDTMVECRNGTAGNLIYKSTLNPGISSFRSGSTSHDAKDVWRFPAALNGEIRTSLWTPFSDFR